MKGTTAWVNIDNGYLNVRASASSEAKSVGELYNGDEVTIQATSGNGKWYKVTSGDITGYCSVDYISLTKFQQYIFSETQLDYIKEQLGVPLNLNVQFQCDDIYYWDAAGIYVSHVYIAYQNELIAGADVDVETGEIVRSIFMYGSM